MKTISLIFVLLLTATLTNAQSIIGIQAGLNRPIIDKIKNDPAVFTHQMSISNSFLGDAYFVSDREKRVNLGGGISVKQTRIYSYIDINSIPIESSTTSIDHKSTFVSVHPILDLGIDKTRYLHILFNPNLNFFVAGGENGYRSEVIGSQELYKGNTDNIRKFVLGFSAQLQFRYPVTKQLMTTASLGYSVNNAISKYIVAENGNVFFHLGVALRLPKSEKKDDKPAETN